MPIEQTPGQKQVRTSFNPNSVSDVDRIKALCAEAIDIVLANAEKDPELAEYATRQIEGAAMWGVKAVTA